MSRGIFSGKLYASVDIDFSSAFDDLSEKEQKSFITDNIGMIDDNDLIDELESRGYGIKERGEE